MAGNALKPIVIIGAGGYAQEVAWLIDDLNNARPEWNFLGFVDPLRTGRAEHYGRPVLAGYETVRTICSQPFFACGMGTPSIRCKEATYAETLGWQAATLIHPSVTRADFVSVGEGTVIGLASSLGPYCRIGRHCSLNLQITIGHDSSVGDFCVLAPGARVLGHVVLEDGVCLGTNSSVYPGRRVGAGATLAANSFLHTDLGAGQSAVGVAARVFFPPVKETS